MEIAVIIVISVLFLAVLASNELRHSRDRADFKELSLNQQNHIKDLLEILRWRSGMPTVAAKIEETSTQNTLPVSQTPNFANNQAFSFIPPENGNNNQTAIKKPIGREARIAAQEKAEQDELFKNG